MSPTDKGANTPESPKTPEPNGESIPDETTPVEPVSESSEISLAKSSGAEDATAEVPTAEAPVADAPIGDASYPAPEDFASSTAASGRSKKLLAIIAGVSVIIIAAIAVLLVVMLNKDDSSSDREAQVNQIIETFIEVQNTGEVTKAAGILCQENLAEFGELKDGEPAAVQINLDSVDGLTFYPVSASATLTISAKDDPSQPAQQVPVRFLNEDGWKICS
ncbi:Rv0361 family membrane protein [Tomitella biformata]|uniref:Rv0361 family membrane protein n=1 Tax=Tomitella biformata TaxID=630403 RepID=UPI00046616C8|nr:hypothetical protein [Tomitella biformata]